MNCIFYASKNGNLEELGSDNRVSIGKGDVVMVELDCDRCFVRFFRNGSKFGDEIKIEPNMTYYPAVTTKRDQGHFQVIQ